MSKRYKPVGDVNYVKDDYFTWGPWPKGYKVYIEVRDVQGPDGYRWTDGCHKVVVEGPQPRPASKTFIGEMAWCNAERYAGDVVSTLQRNEEGRRYA